MFRREFCKHFYSDCGTNFVGAVSEIQKFSTMNSDQNQIIIKREQADVKLSVTSICQRLCIIEVYENLR